MVAIPSAPPTPATSPAPSTVASQDEPAERRMFQLTDLVGNHNKFYLVELWPAGAGKVRFRAQWGRVGSKPQVKEKVATMYEVERQIEEKLRKGYRPVNLHRPEIEEPEEATATPARRIEPKVAQLLEWVFAEAGEYIMTYLAVAVEALSQEQIAEGRRLLAQAQQQYNRYRISPVRRNANLEALAATVQAYYNAIPTKLPARVNRDDVVTQFCQQLSEQEDRLLQLEAAIATMKAQRKQDAKGARPSPYEALGAEIRCLSPEDDAHRRIKQYVERTQVHIYRARVRDVFEVCIPTERKAYEENTVGTSRRELLFHGTRNGYVRHILRQGLICPKAPSNGRMLGNGIYLANKASKSTGYCVSGRRDVPRMLFVVEAALGNAYVAPAAACYNRPPVGYDSVWGKAGHTHTWGTYTLVHDEFVVYSPAQQTIRYLVTFDQG